MISDLTVIAFMMLVYIYNYGHLGNKAIMQEIYFLHGLFQVRLISPHYPCLHILQKNVKTLPFHDSSNTLQGRSDLKIAT